MLSFSTVYIRAFVSHHQKFRTWRQSLFHFWHDCCTECFQNGCDCSRGEMMPVGSTAAHKWSKLTAKITCCHCWNQTAPDSCVRYFRRKKLSFQYCLKLSCNYNNPAYRYVTIFNSKFYSVFERKPTQLPPPVMRVSGDLQAVGFKKSDVITSSIPTTPPWLLTRPVVNFTLHCSDKSNTPPEIFKHRFYELYSTQLN